MGIGWVWARLSMLFPATAADAHMTVREGWQFSRGNGWRLFWIIVIVALPLSIIGWFVDLGLREFGFAIGLSGSLTGNLVFALISQFIAFVGLAVGVSVLSIAYTRIRDAAPAQVLPPNG